MIRAQAASVDGNGNTPLLSVTAIGEQQYVSIDSLPSIELHSLSACGMTYSSASDSGCMVESGSSTATIDDEQTVSPYIIIIILLFKFQFLNYLMFLHVSI